jgi:hypothetical protein
MEGMQSLSYFKNLDFLEDDTPQGLKAKLDAVKTPFNLISMYSYANGQRHIAWVCYDRPVVKRPVEKVKMKSVEEMNKELNDLKK